MSDIFKHNLKKFLADQLSIEELEKITAEEASKNDAQKDGLQHIILELFNRKIISKSVFDKLYFAVSSPASFQSQPTSETSRQVYREPQQASVEPTPQSPPDPKIPFQESLKRFGQRKNTYKDLEKSLVGEIGNDRSLIPKFRLIVQKLEQQQLLHHSICDQLNDCLAALENPSQPSSAPGDYYSQTSSREVTNQEQNSNQQAAAPIESNAREADNTTAAQHDSDADNLPTKDATTDATLANAESESKISLIIQNYANRRLSYQDFEEQIIRSTVLLDDKQAVLTELQQGATSGQVPSVVFESLEKALIEQFPELKTQAAEAADNSDLELPEDIAPVDNNSDTNIDDVAEQEANVQASNAPQSDNNQEYTHTNDNTNDAEQEEFSADSAHAAFEQAMDDQQSPTPLDEPFNDNDQSSSKTDADKADEIDDFPDFDEIVGDGNFEANDTLDQNTPSPEEDSAKDLVDTPESLPLESEETPPLPTSNAESESLGSQNSDNDIQNDIEDDIEDDIDDDKTQIRFTPPIKPPVSDLDDDDKTVVKVRKPTVPVDDDKTVINIKRPVDDDDKTRIKSVGPLAGGNGDRTDVTSTTQEYTSRTSQTSATSTTSLTGTSSTWNKPFEAPQEVVEITIGTVIKGRFRLTEFIGQGGMGDVYKAEDLRRVDAGDVETEVAIKVLNNEFKDHPDSLKALQREARKTQSLAHPHIVNVFDFDRDEFHVFMTMELMRGDPLNTAIKKQKRGFGLLKATKYIKELSTALDYAHRRGIVHSDLKPGNIFIANGEIKVFDFGIARAASNKTEKEGKQDSFDAGSIGALTPSYASPEMLEGAEDADPRDDIYALGCIAYELITGKHPFLKDGKKVPSNVARDEKLKPPKISSLKKWQAKALEQCLAFDRDSRPDNVAQFLDIFLQEKVIVTKKQKIARAVGISVLIGASVGGYFYYKSYKISSFEEMVDTKAHDKLFAESEALLKQDRASQQEIFNNVNIRDKFLKYLSNRAKQLAQDNQFSESDKIIALARKIYPDSAAISIVANELVDIQNNRKIELYDKLDKLLSDNEYFASNYQELRGVWNTISVIEPSDERLQNTQPVFAFEELINKRIEQDQYVNAKEVSDYAIDFLSQHRVFDEFVPTIVRLGNDIQRLQERSLNNERINTLVASLRPISNDTSIEAIAPFLDNISRLSELDPNNSRLLELQKVVKPLINVQLESTFKDYKWADAKELVESYSAVLSKSDLIDSQDRIIIAELAWTDTVNKIKQDIRVRARQSSPESAEKLLPELQNISASAEEIAEMSDAIAQSWILKSRRLQENQDWVNAKAALDSAQGLSASVKMNETVQAEFDNLTLSQTQYASQLDIEQTEALQAQKIKRIEGLEKVVTDIVEIKQISQANLSEFTAAIDSLRIEEPNNNLITSAELSLINRITGEANQLASNNVDEAISMLALGAEFFPTSAEISTLNDQLVTLKQTQLQQETQSNFARLSGNLDKVIQGSLGADSYDQISTILAEMSRLKGFENETSKLSVKASSAFVEKSKTQLKDLRFDEARDTVRYASSLDPAGTNASDLIDQINQAEKAFETAQIELREQSRIESLRANLLSRILTMDFERAKEVRKELQEAGGLDREFTERVRKTFVEKYSERAERAVTEQKFGEAKSWINEAIQEDTNNSDLSRLYDLYKTAEDIVDTIKVNPIAAQQLKQAALSKFTNSAVIAGIKVDVKKPELVKPTVKPPPTMPQPTVEQPKPEPVVQQPKPEPKPPIVPVSKTRRPSDCLPSMAGAGSITTCRDQLVGKDKGPYLVVLPPYNGKSFAISKYEIRIGEYNMYCNSTGNCRAIGGNQLLPVSNLSLANVNKFVDWLSTTSGFTYRIPSEAEWKFAATSDQSMQPSIKNCKVYSGTILQYGVKVENINFQRKQTSNGWGVSNYLGNVQELITISGGYRAIGGHFEDDFSECEIGKTRSVQGNLDNKTGLRLIREL